LGYPYDKIFALDEPGYGAQSNEWLYAEFDLSPYLGMEIKIRFYFGSDFETNRTGWYLDDIAIKPELATAVDDKGQEKIPGLAAEYSLGQNFPNPFNPETTIRYQVAKQGLVKVTIYNLLGQAVATLVDEYQKAGKYRIKWNGKDDSGNRMTAGIYFYNIKSGSFHQTKKMILLP
jgi:hypothetical protein